MATTEERIISSQGTQIKQIKMGAIGTLALTAGNTALALIVSILLARWLGPANYGIYELAISITAVIAIPVQLGLPRLMVREIAQYHANQEWGLLKGMTLTANFLVVALVVAAIAIAAPLLWLAGSEDNTTKIRTISWSLVLLPLVALSSLRLATLRGLKRVIYGQLPEKLIQPILLIALLAIGYSTTGLEAPAAMALTCVAAGVAFLVGTGLLMRTMPSEVQSAQSVYDRKKWLSSLIPFSLISVVSMLGGRTNILLLGIFAVPEREIGFFRVATGVSAFVAIGLTAVNVALAPHVASLHSRGETKRLQRIISKCSLVTIGMAMPIAIVFLLAGNVILTVVYGREYGAAYSLLAILCLGQLVSVSAGSVTLVLNMTGHENDVLRISIYTIALNLMLNIILINLFGAVGAAVAAASSLALSNIALNICARKTLGIETSIIGIMRS